MICNEPVRYNFAPTSHDPLAQSMGTFTFHVDTDGGLWECFGAKETKVDVFVLDDDQTITRSDDTPATLEEICRTRIEFDKPYTVTIQPIMAKGGRIITVADLLKRKLDRRFRYPNGRRSRLTSAPNTDRCFNGRRIDSARSDPLASGLPRSLRKANISNSSRKVPRRKA